MSAGASQGVLTTSNLFTSPARDQPPNAGPRVSEVYTEVVFLCAHFKVNFSQVFRLISVVSHLGRGSGGGE